MSIEMLTRALGHIVTQEIGPDTRLYIKIHFWGSMVPPYSQGVEIIPIFAGR